MAANYIKASYAGRYVNAKHFNFMLFTKTAITVHYPEIEQKFPVLSRIFIKAFDHENHVFEKADRKLYNKSLNEAGTARSVKFRYLRDAIKVFLLDPDTEKVKAAEILMEIFKLYGGTSIINKPMDSESGLLTNLVEDLETTYAEQVTLLGETEKVAELKAANDRYIEILSERTQYDADFGKAAVAAARKATDKAYRELVNAVNSIAFADETGALERFIAYMNAEIDRYRIQLGIGVGNPEAGDVEEDFPEEELPEEELPEEELPPTEEEPTTPPAGGGSTGSGSTGGSTETPTDPTKILLLFNDGAHGNVIVKRMEVEPGYQLTAADLPEGYVYAFKADDQADIDAASPGDTVWVTLAPRG